MEFHIKSKGALERLNGTADCVVAELKTMKNVKFSEFVRIFDAWVNEYNDTPHSALTECDDQGNKTQRTPNEAFNLGLKKVTVRIANSDLLELAFTQSIARKVSKDGLISYGGRHYKIASKYAKAHEYINLISSLTDRNFLELVVPNSEEEKRNGGSEYTTIPLYPLELKSDIDFKDRVKDEQSEEKKRLREKASNVAPNIERLKRELSKADGTYVDEDHFQKEILNTLYYKEPKSTPSTDGSAYGNVEE